MKQLTTSLYLKSDSAMLHPLKRSGNPSLKLIRAESLKHVNVFDGDYTGIISGDQNSWQNLIFYNFTLRH